jgi:hypothetical protein
MSRLQSPIGLHKVARISITKAVEAVLELPSVRKATVFQHPELTVVATKRHK